MPVVVPDNDTFTVLIFIQAGGTPQTGLTPTFQHYKDVTDPSTPSDVAQPTIYEIANGMYAFRPTATTDKTYSFVIDAGTTICLDAERYIPGAFSWKDAPSGAGTTIGDIATDVTFIKDIQDADFLIDTATTPWNLVLKKKGTSTELVRKALKDIVGADVTAIGTFLARREEP